MTEQKDVKITCPGPTGIGTEIEIGGKRVDLVRKIDINIRHDWAPLLYIERLMSAAEISGKFEVDEVVIFIEQPDKRYRLVEVEE